MRKGKPRLTLFCLFILTSCNPKEHVKVVPSGRRTVKLGIARATAHSSPSTGITGITLLMSGTAGYTFINIQAFKVNNWFIKVTFTRNPEPIEQRSWGSGLRVNDLYKPIIHFKCLLGVYLFMNKDWLWVTIGRFHAINR